MYKKILIIFFIIMLFSSTVNATDAIIESQLDALKCWTWGIPAVALFGTGSKKQYQILNKSGIRFYHLAFDGDLAGQHGAKRFIENIKNVWLIFWLQIGIIYWQIFKVMLSLKNKKKQRRNKKWKKKIVFLRNKKV